MALFSYSNPDGEESSYEADLGNASTRKKPRRRRRRGLSERGLALFAGVFLVIGLYGTSVLSASLPANSSEADFGSLSAIIVCLACLLVSLPIYAWLLVSRFRMEVGELEISVPARRDEDGAEEGRAKRLAAANANTDAGAKARHGWRLFWSLLILAAVCEVPWDLVTWRYQEHSGSNGSLVGALYGSTAPKPWFNLYTQNPVWALALCALVLICLRWIRRHQAPVEGEGPKTDVWLSAGTAGLLRILLLFASFLWVWMLNIGQVGTLFPTGLMMFVFVLLFYGLRYHENTMTMLAAAIGALEALAPAVGVLIVHFHNDEDGYAHSWGRYVWYVAIPLVMLGLGLSACQGLL